MIGLKKLARATAVLGLALSCLLCVPKDSFADGKSNRTKHPFGLFVEADPFPGVFAIGGGLGYNVSDLIRFHGSFTTVSGLKIIKAAMDFFIPSWSVSPYAGLGIANFNLSASSPIGSFSASLTGPMFELGLDTSTGFGMNFGGGAYFTFGGVGFLAYLGWYF